MLKSHAVVSSFWTRSIISSRASGPVSMNRFRSRANMSRIKRVLRRRSQLVVLSRTSDLPILRPSRPDRKLEVCVHVLPIHRLRVESRSSVVAPGDDGDVAGLIVCRSVVEHERLGNDYAVTIEGHRGRTM